MTTYEVSVDAVSTPIQVTVVAGILDSGGGGGTANWGEIQGTLANQTDLQDALDQKLGVDAINANLIIYPTTASSDVGGYTKLVDNIADPDYDSVAVDVPTGAITGTAQLLASLVSEGGLIQGNTGVVNITIVGNIRRTSGSGTASFYFEFYKRTALGVETLLSTGANTIPVSSASYVQFFDTALINNEYFALTDRIVLKFYGNRISGGSNPSFEFQFGGATPVRALIPIPLVAVPSDAHNDLSGLQGGALGEYYHVTEAEKTVIENTSGTNTGDQDISGIATNASDISAIELEQITQNDAIALNTAKRSYPLADENRLANTSGTNTGDQDISGIATNASDITAIELEQITQNNAIAGIYDKVDFTGLVEGDILRHNGTKLVKISEDYFQRRQNALSSFHPSQIQAWDDFQDNLGEQSGRISPSGHTWIVADRIDSSIGHTGIFSVANFQSKNSTNVTNKFQLLPISQISGMFADGVFSWGGNTTGLYVVFLNINTGNSIYIYFTGGYTLSQNLNGVITTLATQTSDNFPRGSSNSITGGTFEISVTRRSFELRYHIGFKVAGYIGGFESGAGDFFNIMEGITHFGTGGFRGSALNAIRIYKMWE